MLIIQYLSNFDLKKFAFMLDLYTNYDSSRRSINFNYGLNTNLLQVNLSEKFVKSNR